MVLPYFLNTEQATDYVRSTFIWRWSGHIRLPHPFPKDYRSLCPYFNLNMAKTSAQDFCIPKLTQAIFYAIVLNDVMALGVTCVIIADALTSVESTDTSFSSEEETNGLGRAVLKRGRALKEPVREDVAEKVVAKGIIFPGLPRVRIYRMGRAPTSLT
ncbi:hypothetical protein Cgig2_025018 [Carnegiea gigantea]|uniref:Uncharacterized protein n=1 Tax=Carnegiea gigantea TaxID=171969 RepID=A0A9Q1QA56_9CARY|nr:hypothetical protein Cgig2_025018 [Carnegiea gigantea]